MLCNNCIHREDCQDHLDAVADDVLLQDCSKYERPNEGTELVYDPRALDPE